MIPTRAILDANVLFDSYLRDLFLELALADNYAPLWTAEILEELRRALGRRYPTSVDKHGRMIEALSLAFSDASVIAPKRPEGSLGCTDPGDEHVLWSAMSSEATHLVTHNISDFPIANSAENQPVIMSPDEFLMTLAARQPVQVRDTATKLLRLYSRPSLTISELCRILERSRCPQFAGWLSAPSRTVPTQAFQRPANTRSPRSE
jgi:predicted nucleic acid-binding protein